MTANPRKAPAVTGRMNDELRLVGWIGGSVQAEVEVSTDPSIIHRRIEIYCNGLDARGHGRDHDDQRLGALVSLRAQGGEQWTGEPGGYLRHEYPDLSHLLPPSDDQADKAVEVSALASWFEIRCPTCRRNFRSGDLLGAGFKTAESILADRMGVAPVSPEDEARILALSPGHACLTKVADSGVSRLSLSAVAAILEPLPKR